MKLWPYPTTACGESRFIGRAQGGSRTSGEVSDFWESAVKEGDTQNLQDFVQREVHLPFLLDDGHQHISANRNPNLRLHGVRRSPVERLDSQMLLDPAKEQFDLPSTSVNIRDCQCRQGEIVAQEHEPLARFEVAVDDATQGFGVELRRQWTAQDDCLVATQPRRLVHEARPATVEVEVGFGSCHKERQAGGQTMESIEIEITSVHHVEGAGFDRQDVEDVDVVCLAIGNQHETRDISAQVDQRVKFDSGLVASEMSPWEKCQAEVDGRGIQRVCRLPEFGAEAVGEVQFSRSGDQDMCEVFVDPPVAEFVGIGESAASHDTAKPGVVKFLVEGVKTDFDVPQALAISQLSEGHAEELIETGEAAKPLIAVVASDATIELVSGQRVDQLRKDVAIVEHEPSPDAMRRVGKGSRLLESSDRKQRISYLSSSMATRYSEEHKP
jgi:hypothetical protein